MVNYVTGLKEQWKACLIGLLIISNIFVWVAVYERHTGEILSLYFFDVGQGDAIFIDSPRHGRVLIDGGRNKKVLTELGKVLPFADRRIDVVIATHPDGDHIGGLPEVLSRYSVGIFLEPGVSIESSVNDELHARLLNQNIPVLEAKRGMVVNFGDGVYLTILFPNQDVSWWPNNDGSIVSRLSYGDRVFLLTGDAVFRTENILLNLNPGILKADVLQAGHHGSHTSTSLAFAESVLPAYAVVSSGKDNSYGHPHQTVLDILAKVGAEVVNTALFGTIRFDTDGHSLELK